MHMGMPWHAETDFPVDVIKESKEDLALFVLTAAGRATTAAITVTASWI